MRVLTEHLETTHTRSQKEASNISQIETLHPFNFLNELVFFLYQNLDSEDSTYDIYLISLRITRGTETELLEYVSLIELNSDAFLPVLFCYTAYYIPMNE